ncbi:hypothetical protein DSO57_1017052 [Entomophthora muscae]|uniref:Uncharacterized protein n=1 Tax=Entomophthora muscae TaxID=34485 RepID=A0ACC2T511_9FUNG|nr:hypothetical protein DSO57_1017052 [Entomophthora muscae]
MKASGASKVEYTVYPPVANFSFDPLEYKEENLLKKYTNYRLPKRGNVLSLSEAELSKLFRDTVIEKGEPLVISNYHKLPDFDKHMFSLKWLTSKIDNVSIDVRDTKSKKDKRLKFNEFLRLNEDKASSDIHYYAKDIECPVEWRDICKKFLPPPLRHLGPRDLTRKVD